jgi:hypothetical protein
MNAVDYDRNPQVISISPKNNELNVSTTLEKIVIGFNMDLDQTTLIGNFQVEGGGQTVPATLSYADRVVTLTLTAPLKPNTTYNIRIIGSTDPNIPSGIMNVFGKPLLGYAQSIFTTTLATTLPAPVPATPLDQVVIRTQPKFDWAPVTGGLHYQLELSQSNTMSPILWPPNGASYFSGPIEPGIEMPDGTYYWRIRAISANGESGQWSEIQQFYLTRVVDAPISEEDTVAVDIMDFKAYIEPEVVEYFPQPGTANLTTKVNTIYFHVMGPVAAGDVSLEMLGESVTGDGTDHGQVSGTLEVLPQPDGTTIIAFTPVVIP